MCVVVKKQNICVLHQVLLCHQNSEHEHDPEHEHDLPSKDRRDRAPR